MHSRLIQPESGRRYVRVLEAGGQRVYPDRAPPGTPHESIINVFLGRPGCGPVLEFEPDTGLWGVLHDRVERIAELLAVAGTAR